MVCSEAKEKILEACERQELEDREVLSHLKECEDCKIFSESLSEMGQFVRNIDAPPLPAGFTRKVYLAVKEERQRSSSLRERILDILLGRLSPATDYSKSFVLQSVLMSVIAAAVTGAAAIMVLYLQQSWVRFLFSKYGYLNGVGAYDSFLWIPFARAWDLYRSMQIPYFAASVSFMLFLILLFARLLNLRGMWESLRKRERLSPLSIILPLAGVYSADIFFNLILLYLKQMSETSPYVFGAMWVSEYIPAYYSYFPSIGHENTLSSVLLAFNPLFSPLAGLILSALAVFLLFSRSIRGIPSLVTCVYGSLASAAIMCAASQHGAFWKIMYFFQTVIAAGNTGILLSQKNFGIMQICLVVAFGFLSAMFLSLLRFERKDHGRAFSSKRIAPAILLILSLIIVISASLGWFGSRALAMKETIIARGIEAQSRRIWMESEKGVREGCETNSIVALTEEPDKVPGYCFTDHIKPYIFPSVLLDENEYRKMDEIAGKPFSLESLNASGFLMANAVASWDQEALMERMIALAKSSPCYQNHGKMRRFYNGRSPSESQKFLDILGDEKEFCQSREKSFFLAYAWESLGETEKAHKFLSNCDRFDRLSFEKPRSRPLRMSGRVKGKIMVNGQPAENLPLRLFTIENFPYVIHHYDTDDSEDGFLYTIDQSLDEEMNFCAAHYDDFRFSDKMLMAPFIVARTCADGSFEFDNLIPDEYYLVLRFPFAVKKVKQHNGVGVIKVTPESPARDLGTINVKIE